MKVAFITGITGQYGSYLAEFLLSKDNKVDGPVPLIPGVSIISMKIPIFVNGIYFYTTGTSPIQVKLRISFHASKF